MDIEPPDAEAYEASLNFQLDVLRAVPGSSSVLAYPKDGFNLASLNKNGVRLKLEVDGELRSLNIAAHRFRNHTSRIEANNSNAGRR